MKKYFLTMATVALFAIGFVASDEEEGASSTSSSKPKTELKQETEAERKARDGKKEAERKETKKKEIAEAGYNRGYEYGFEGHDDVIGNPKTIHYTTRYGAPKSNEEKELFSIWKENWQKGYEDGSRARYSN